MSFALIYGAMLLLVALLAGRAHRSALSLPVLFMGAGFLAGDGMLGWLPLHHADETLKDLAELALFAVLFADGMRLDARELRRHWSLPARALLAGLPLTLAAIAALGHYAAGLPWGLALLLAAVLTPTDPVFASAIVGRDEMPHALRRLLNVESGLNDGLALPMVLGILAALGAGRHPAASLAGQVAGAVALGMAMPWLCNRLRLRVEPEPPGIHGALFIAAIGLLVYALCKLWSLNEYMGAFCAAVTLASVAPRLASRFCELGEQASELLKFAALLAFGAMLAPAAFATLHAGQWVFVAGVLLLARPLPVLLVLTASRLSWRERVVAAWFGPKGFASLVYAVIVAHSGLQGAAELFQLAAVAVAASILAHSSSDVPLAKWLAGKAAPAARE